MANGTPCPFQRDSRGSYRPGSSDALLVARQSIEVAIYLPRGTFAVQRFSFDMFRSRLRRASKLNSISIRFYQLKCAVIGLISDHATTRRFPIAEGLRQRVDGVGEIIPDTHYRPPRVASISVFADHTVELARVSGGSALPPTWSRDGAWLAGPYTPRQSQVILTQLLRD